MAQVDELRELIYCADVPATVGTRARIVLWFGENRPKKEIAAMAGVSRPTVNLWLSRYEAEGVAGLLERKRGAGREQVPATIRAKILAATRSAPPEGLSQLVFSGDGEVHRPHRKGDRVASLRCHVVARNRVETASAWHVQAQP